MSSTNLINTIKIDAKYNGLVVAAFDVKVDGDNNVRFTNNISVSDTTTATFLKNIEEEASINGNGNMKATKVSDPTELLDKDKIPLFCVHGWQGRPDVWLNVCKDVLNKFGPKYQVIPVIWPGNGNVEWPNELVPVPIAFDYPGSQRVAASAALAFKKAFDNVNTIIKRKSLIAVSMGNWFLKELARVSNDDPKMIFEDIFMSAADVDQDIFTRDEGKNIVNMLSNKVDEENNGKVYIIHNSDDANLKLSNFINGVGVIFIPFFGERTIWNSNKQRLGLYGAAPSSTSPRVQNVDVTAKQNSLGNNNIIPAINPKTHGYLFEPYMIEFYNQEEPKSTTF